MKIVCENCSTKYSIADEKVRGKVFKIRCKKCGHIIVVKGTSMGAAEAAPAEPAAGQFDDKETRVFDYSGFAESMSSQAVWHLVIDGGQVGPLSAEQVHAKFDAGEIDAETYIWKETFKDWLRLSEVDEFAALAEEEDGKTELMNEDQAKDMFASAAAPTEASAAPVAATPAPKPKATPAPAAAAAVGGGGGLFGDADASEPAASADSGGVPAATSTPAPSGGGGGGLFGDAEASEPAAPAATPAPAGGADAGLFGSPAAAGPSADKGSLFPDEPAEDDAAKMTGQRNENSVLFSLSNLQSLATGGGGGPAAPSAPAASASAGGGGGGAPKPGYASAKTEGSGLVDIRAMAATTLPADKKDSAGEGFSFSSPSLAAPISSAPVLMPVADSGKPKWLLPAIIGGGVLLVAVAVLLVVVLMKGDDEKGDKAAAVADSSMAGDMSGDMKADDMKADDMAADMKADDMAADMKADDMAADMKADDMAADMKADDMAAMGSGDAKSDGAMSASGRRRRRRVSSGGSSRRRASSGGGGSTTMRPTPRPRTSGGGGGGSSLQDLLRRAGGSMMASGGGGGASNLPKRLSPGDIRRGVGRVLGSARACYNRYKVAGTCRVRVVISGSSGRPGSVRVLGSFSGTPTGRCVERAFRRSKYKKFQQGSQSFVFPLIFR